MPSDFMGDEQGAPQRAFWRPHWELPRRWPMCPACRGDQSPARRPASADAAMRSFLARLATSSSIIPKEGANLAGQWRAQPRHPLQTVRSAGLPAGEIY